MNWKERIVNGSSPRFRRHPGVTLASAKRFAESAIPNHEFVVAGQSGAAVVSKLEFDTDLLQMPCGRIAAIGAKTELDAFNVAQQALGLAQKLGILHLSVRCDAEDSMILDALTGCGFEAVDAILTFTLSLHSYQQAESPANIRLATEADAEAVGEIARTAFSIDRFHADPMVEKNRADELHYVWAKNSVLGVAADAVIVATDGENQPIGFVTCKLNRGTYEALGKLVGTIVLVATSEQARGKGIGRQMTAAALNWFMQSGVDVVEVGTQAVNQSAASLYERSGFTLTDHSISLRKWLGTGTSIIETETESAKILL